MLNNPFTSAIVPVTVFPVFLLIKEIVAYSRGPLVDLSNTLPDIVVFCFGWAPKETQKRS